MNREKEIIKTSILSILVNFVLAGFKALVGFFANSVAIISDALNNLSDAISSLVTIIGTKLASKEPDKEHPYGHGRTEYISALIVSAIVLYAGVTALKESIEKIIHPENTNYTYTTFVILIAGIIVKFVLGLYVKEKGKKVNSDSLVASGLDAFNDAILSISVLASAIVYIIFDINLESFVSAIVSVFIIKSGYEMIKDAVDDMLGTRVESSLSKKIKKEILKNKEVKGAYDLILNDFGPDKYLGAVHIEVPDTFTATEIDALSRKITADVYKKFGVMLHTIGIYSVNTKDEGIMNMRKDIIKMIYAHKGVIQTHGFYVNKKERYINIDIIIDFAVKNRVELYEQILGEVQSKYRDYKVNMTLDVDASD